MRSNVLTAIASAIGLAAVAASSSPLVNKEFETCNAPTTVFVTVPGVSTVTIHDSPINTVYVTGTPSYATVHVSELPTTTLTRFYTSTHTTSIALPTSENAGAATYPYYATTVTETAIVETVYVPISAAATTGPLSFVVEGGSTSWVGGVAPPPTASYVVVTSAVTVVPVNTPVSDPDHTRTTTIHTTVFNSHQYTVTMTLASKNATVTNIGAPSSAGTGSPYTGISPGGWNATSGFGYGISASKSASNGEPVFITAEPSYDLYTTRASVSLTASDAKSGFAALSTPSSSSDLTNGASTSAQSASRVYEAVTTYSYAAYPSIKSNSGSATIPPYANTTSVDPGLSTLTNGLGTVTSTSPSKSSSSGGVSDSTLVSASSTESNNGVATSSASYLNNTSISIVSTKSADGVATSSTASVGGFSYVPPVFNSSTAFVSSTTASGVAASSVPSSFLTVYSSASPSANNSTRLLSSTTSSPISSSSAESITSPALSTIAGPMSSASASVTSTALGISTSVSSSSSISDPGYAAGPHSTFSSLATSTSFGVITSSMSSFSTVYIPSSSEVPTLSSSTSNLGLSSSTSSISASMPYSSSLSNSLSSPTSTSASSSASASPTSCGEVGDFTLNFDDIPPLVATNDTINTVQPMPVFNPYHQFDFSDGFTVVPPPTDPYLPSSKPLLTEFIPNFNINGSNPQAGPNTKEFGFSGDIGNGDHGLTGCFGFNFYGASFGCDSLGPDCDFTFTGFRYDRDTMQTNQVAQKGYSIPACPALQDCSLVPIKFTSEFMNLDSIRINVTVADAPKIWWMDDVQLGWFNNTCEVGLCRIRTHIH